MGYGLMVKHKEITLQRLREMLEAYGASAARWPESERLAAEALIAASAEARALMADAVRLDHLLDLAPVDEPSSALVSRLMAARPRASEDIAQARVAKVERRSLWRSFVDAIWPYGSPAFPAGALVASVMLGVAFGSLLDVTLPLGTGQVTMAASDDVVASEEFIALALADTVWLEDWMQ